MFDCVDTLGNSFFSTFNFPGGAIVPISTRWIFRLFLPLSRHGGFFWLVMPRSRPRGLFGSSCHSVSPPSLGPPGFLFPPRHPLFTAVVPISPSLSAYVRVCPYACRGTHTGIHAHMLILLHRHGWVREGKWATRSRNRPK